MRASIAAGTIDPLGQVWVDLLSTADLGRRARRVTRIATLDGGAAINDFGETAADMTLRLRWTPERATDTTVERLLREQTTLTCCTERGAYACTPESIDRKPEQTTLTLLVSAQLSE